MDLYGVLETAVQNPITGFMGRNPNFNEDKYTFGMPAEEIEPEYLFKCHAVFEKKQIDGKYYWSLHSLQKTN